jgi:hypothetical protein
VQLRHAFIEAKRAVAQYIHRHDGEQADPADDQREEKFRAEADSQEGLQCDLLGDIASIRGNPESTRAGRTRMMRQKSCPKECHRMSETSMKLFHHGNCFVDVLL